MACSISLNLVSALAYYYKDILTLALNRIFQLDKNSENFFAFYSEKHYLFTYNLKQSS